jgi:hypothetical protein
MNPDGFIREFDLPVWMRKVASKAVKEAEIDLGLPRVFIQYWRATPECQDDAVAWVYQDATAQAWTISLCVDRLQNELDVRFVCFHEMRHLFQTRFTRFSDKQKAENDANLYAWRKTGVLFRHGKL